MAGQARSANVKHAPHGCDAGSVEAQRLVERRRILPSQKGSFRIGATCGQVAGGHGKAVVAQAACKEDPTVQAAGKARTQSG
jgi:hypothetical protein